MEQPAGTPTLEMPSWSSDGRIAFRDHGVRMTDQGHATLPEVAGIYVHDLASGVTVRRLPSGTGPRWSPGADRIVFWEDQELSIADLEDGTVRSLDTGHGFTNPASWAPCEDSLVYVSSVGASYDYTLWRYDVARDTCLAIAPGDVGFRNPHWFAGCDSIAFRQLYESDGGAGSRICVASKGLDEIIPVFDCGPDAFGVSISTDGRYVSYQIGFGSKARLFIYDRVQGLHVVEGSLSGFDAGWIPDEHAIVFASATEGVSERGGASLKRFDVESGETRVVY